MKTIVNAIGEQCPIPVVKATKALEAMKEPGILEVHVDNETAVQNLSRMANGKGLAVKAEKTGERYFVVTLEVAAPVTTSSKEETPACIPDRRGNTVVAIGSATMGTGNDELGAILMKGFLYALTGLDELPATILFYNGGATITAGNGPSLQDLKDLEAQGVEILTCGTCLDYYGIKEQLAVGSVTNMYTIVEKLNAATKVIRP